MLYGNPAASLNLDTRNEGWPLCTGAEVRDETGIPSKFICDVLVRDTVHVLLHCDPLMEE